MRCPKCGFISFDHLDECLKCSKNIKSASGNLGGSVYNVATPAFLFFDDKEKAEETSGSFETTEALDDATSAIDMDENFVDEDLDILVADDNEEEEAVAELHEEDDVSPEISLDEFEEEMEESQGEIEIDMGQFEDTFAEEPEEAEIAEEISNEIEDESFDISLPEELEDISDLAPPPLDESLGVPESPTAAAVKEEPRTTPGQEADASVDIDFDDLDFDLGLDGLDSSKGSVASQSPVMDLDDIDFSEALEQPGAEQPKKQIIMDDDLDFDLDLGDLSLDKEE